MSFLDNVYHAAQQIGSGLKDSITAKEPHAQNQEGGSSSASSKPKNRFDSFAPRREGNDAKWFVDGAGYFWAVSEALEQAKESIWILDWWLSPELYLRRPPSQNEQYRLDRMLLAAAQRGCKINIIVYKEVTQALTRKYLNPGLPDYLHSLLPTSASRRWKSVARLGLRTAFKSMEILESTYPLMKPPIPVSSAHTKHALESLHENISVFRHPDHLPDAEVWESSFLSSLKNLKLTAASVAKLPEDTLKALYGIHGDTVLYWAHHEKLCIIDGPSSNAVAFMGGLDLCFGRWDTNQHSIADAHPGDLELTVFPGQDYNDARIMDFQNVSDWQDNKLDRLTNPRMGWSDISFCLRGPVVEDLCTHFVQRHNFIYDEKYDVPGNTRYKRFAVPIRHEYHGGHEYRHHGQGFEGLKEEAKDRLQDGIQYVIGNTPTANESQHGHENAGTMPCQITRSCAEWSHGVHVENSIANAYIDAIKNSKHFVYIENQFFITATGDLQHPVRNQIGAAIVERVLRAAEAGEKYKIIINIPAIPAFAGDLRSDESLPTRAIMNYQYKSINRGEHSIFGRIRAKGYDPSEYIELYNLRNYDRINSNATMKEAERQAGVTYEEARKEHDDQVGAGFGGKGEGSKAQHGDNDLFDRYQRAAGQISHTDDLSNGRWDSVAECYMLNGTDIRKVPWKDGDLAEIDAFVSEELYIHTKLMICDDSVVLVGSANLNDRSQLGYHDSEIVVVVEDPEPVESHMNGQPWQASRFAASLRRQIFRKHLGLLPPQDFTKPDANFHPVGVPNAYDWGSAEDATVADPLCAEFEQLWRSRAKTNTDAFEKVFRAIPSDRVRTWKDYQQYYERFFHEDTKAAEKLSLYKWGHVCAEDFAPGEEGLKQIKDVLASIKGTLVEMPLHFLEEEDIAKEGLTLNAFTAEVYT